jgi:hypothetical protein
MLTIKHIEKGGSEGIIEAKSVHAPMDETPRKVRAFGVDDPMADEGVVTYGNGVVYVMNAHGSTVAKYDLD